MSLLISMIISVEAFDLILHSVLSIKTIQSLLATIVL